MGKLNNIFTNLAKPPAPKTGIEVGTSSQGQLPSIFDEEFIDTTKVQADDLKKMLDNDGTIQALYNTIVMPILGSNWTIEPDDPESEEAIKQSEWVEESLRTPPHKGGMSTPFDLVLAQAMRAVLEGYAGFEKVYDIVDGRIVFKKIAWRDPTSITMRTDGRGGFNGLRQRAFISDNYVDVVIPLERCWLYTYGKEFHNLRGRSAFMAAYVAYDKKRRLLYLAEQQAQNEAFKIKIVKGSENSNQDELDSTTAAVDEVGVRATIGVPNGYDISTLNDTSGLNLLPFIEFQNAEMARSILAMFILLGTGSKTGSYALSQDQSDFFIQALMSIRRSLENHITSYLIPDLYKFNFANPEYGTFKFEDITDSTVDLLKQTFIKLTEKDRLPSAVIDGIVQKMADKLDIDIDVLEQAIGEPDENDQPTEPGYETDDTGDSMPMSPPTSNNTRRNMSLLSTDGWKRELTPAESKVNFTGIESKLNSLEGETVRAIKPIYDALVADATIKINKYLESGEYDKITEKNIFDENLKNQYIKVLKESGLEAYLYGKNGASDELDVKAPATPKESKDFFADNAKAIVEKQLSDLIFKIQAEVSAARRKDQLSTTLAVGDIIAAITAVFISYYSDTIGVTATTAVSVGVNRGRKDVFNKYETDIYAYQYSAILDTATCPTCESLDGKVLDQASYKKTSYDPPIHFNCRCIWVAILKDEVDPPLITGFPDESKLLEPSLSRITEEQIIELGRRAVQDEVDRLLAEG